MSAYCMCCKAELDENHIPKFCPNCGSKLEGRIASSLEEAEGASLSSGEVRPSVTIPGTPANPAQIGFTGLGMHGMYGMYGSPAVSEPHFTYSTNGMMMYSGVTYKVFVRDGQYYAQVRLSGMAPDTAPVFPVEPEFFAKISDSITAAGGDSWDGFNKSALGVFDGEHYNMEYNDGNGRKIDVSGYMAWPENFGAAKQVWNEMFYELYDKHFPNYGKRLSEYITGELAEKYGRLRKQEAEIRYMSCGDLMYNYSDLSFPDCIVTYCGGNLTGEDPEYAKEHPSAEALVVRMEKYPYQDGSGNGTELILELYRADEQGIRKVTKITALGNAVLGDAGNAGIFYLDKDGKRNIGVYRKRTHRNGEIYKKFAVFAGEFAGGEWKETLAAELVIPRGQTQASEEDAERFAASLEAFGLVKTAETVRESRNDMTVYSDNTKEFFGLYWSNNIDDGFHTKLEHTPEGKPVGNYKISVSASIMYPIR